MAKRAVKTAAKHAAKPAGKSATKSRTGPATKSAARRPADDEDDGPPVSVEDYTKFISGWGRPEWIALCAETSSGALAEAFASAVEAKDHWRNVPIRSAAKPPKELFPPLVPVVQVEDCAWSSALWITAWPVDEDLADAAVRFAKKLSAKLRTRTFTFMGEHTGGGQDLQVFDAGKPKLHAGWFDGEPLPDFFEKAGVYIPPCYALRKGKELTLCAAPQVAARIVRADVVDIGDDPY